MDEITPSGQLGADLRNMSLGSQQPWATQERPPVPMFAEAGVPAASQQDLDYVTPVDQFQLEYDPGDKDARHQRSPARLSPNRIKRPRKAGEDMLEGCSEDCSSQGPPSRAVTSNPYAQGRRVVVRPQSPPSFRNAFDGSEGDGVLVHASTARAAAAAAAQQQQYSSRFKLDFKDTGVLGQGSFSKVLRVQHRLDGREYAVKRSSSEVVPGSQQFVQFVQEVQALAAASPHPHIVQYYTAWREPGPSGAGEHLYIQLEKCDATLAAHASLGDPLREPELLELLRQMASALAHLHSHGVAHMDVKPENIYLRHSEDGIPIFKLGDFGQATCVDGSGAAQVNEGDSRYLPHEVLNGSYARLDKADMFSLGITLYELATGAVGDLPANGAQYQALRQGIIGLLPSVSMNLQNVIKSLLSPDPGARPSAHKLLEKLAQRQQGQQQLPHQRQEEHEERGTAAVQKSQQPKQAAAGGRLGGLVLQRSVIA